jgi:hypothetical protein
MSIARKIAANYVFMRGTRRYCCTLLRTDSMHLQEHKGISHDELTVTRHNRLKESSGQGHKVMWHTQKSHAPARVCVHAQGLLNHFQHPLFLQMHRDFWITSNICCSCRCTGTSESLPTSVVLADAQGLLNHFQHLLFLQMQRDFWITFNICCSCRCTGTSESLPASVVLADAQGLLNHFQHLLFLQVHRDFWITQYTSWECFLFGFYYCSFQEIKSEIILTHPLILWYEKPTVQHR